MAACQDARRAELERLNVMRLIHTVEIVATWKSNVDGLAWYLDLQLVKFFLALIRDLHDCCIQDPRIIPGGIGFIC